MFVGTCKVYMTAEWVCSLKDKRSIVKSLIQKIKNKFNVSIAEIENQDVHQTITIGFACLSNDKNHVDNIIRNVLNYLENNTDAVIDDVVVEML